jgi:hypothetical protein
MVQRGDWWAQKSDRSRTPWEVTESVSGVVTLRSGKLPPVTVPELELEDEWVRLLNGAPAVDVAQAIHQSMLKALKETDKNADGYYEVLTKLLRQNLAGFPLPEWMTHDFWSVEPDPGLPHLRAHRVIPTMLVGRNPVLVVERGKVTSYTATIGELFVRADNPISALAGLARIVKARGH